MQDMGSNLPRTSLFCLSQQNPIRRATIFVVRHRYFDAFILIMILANSLALAISSNKPGFDSTNLGKGLAKADVYFLGVFALEMMLKWVALGVVLAPGTYFRNGELL